MLNRRLGVLLMCVALCASVTTAAVSDLQSYYTYLRTLDTTIFSGSVLALDTTGKVHTSSVSLGAGRFTTNVPMTESTSFRINALSEVLVATSVVRLVSQGILPFSLNEAIPSGYLPRGVSDFYNPSFPLTKITLLMLLQHTSSITETDFTTYAQTVSTGSVGTLTDFCNNYFTVSSSTGGNTTKTSIWSTLQPGLAATYSYSRANIALLSCVVNVAIASNVALVTSSNKTAAAYIQELIFSPLGMSGSFLLSQAGAAPSSTAPFLSPVFTGDATVQDVSSSGAADSTDSLIHPAYLADYMYYSSASDLGKVVRSLFLQASGSTTTFATIGTQLLSSTISVATVTGVAAGVTRQGLGITYFDGSAMCTAAIASGIITTCPLTASSTVYGSLSRGARSMVGFFCTTQVSSSNPTCVVVQLSYYNIGSTSTKPYTYVLGLGAAALQSAIGSTSQAISASASDDNSIYGFYVFLGVAGVFVFVVIASYVAEHLIQPAPVVAAVPPQALPIPQAYRQGGGGYDEDKYYDDEGGMPYSHQGGGGGYPGGGYYDN